MAKPHRLARIEAAFHPLDISVARAALFDLLAEGRVIAPDLDFRAARAGYYFSAVDVMKRPDSEALDLSRWPSVDINGLDEKAREIYHQRGVRCIAVITRTWSQSTSCTAVNALRCAVRTPRS